MNHGRGVSAGQRLVSAYQTALCNELLPAAIKADLAVDDRVHTTGALPSKREILLHHEQSDPRLSEGVEGSSQALLKKRRESL